MEKTVSSTNQSLSNPILYLMSITAGLVVANLYYSQPLLNQMAASFNTSKAAVSQVPFASQLGYAVGLLLIVPLGDMFRSEKILSIDFVFIILSLLGAATASSLEFLLLSNFIIGVTCSIPQFLVPMAAKLADDKQRGRAIGVVMTGLLSGIIGSRVISGLIGGQYNWRTMYYVALVSMIVLCTLIYLKLPRLHPHYKGSYKTLMKSIWFYVKTDADLRLASVRGALLFAGLSAMWTTLVFVLKDSFGYGSVITGVFGILGIVGALGSGIAGRLNDRIGKEKMIVAGLSISLISYIIFLFSTHFIFGLAIGVILVDLGMQVLHVTNQSIIFGKNPEARNRINTVYMVTYFIGGALGTFIGAKAYVHFEWIGVSVFGILCTLATAVVHYLFRRSQ